MKTFKILSFSALAGLFVFLSQPSNQSLDGIREKLKSYTREKMTDKVYLHTDKNVLLPGDTLWFKAWCIHPNEEVIKEKSRTLALHLIKPGQKPTLTKKYRIKKGSAHGHLIIPETAGFGHHQLMAYTGLMKKKSSNSVFTQEVEIKEHIPRIFIKGMLADSVYHAGEDLKGRIIVYNDLKQPLKKVPLTYSLKAGKKILYEETDSTNNKGFKRIRFELPGELPESPLVLTAQTNFRGYDARYQTVVPTRELEVNLRFFPESGHLLSKGMNRVAFKATDPFGNACDFKGILMDRQNRKIKDIRSYYRGMGTFDIDPGRYPGAKVKITAPVEKDQTFSLPRPVDNGYGIRLEKQKTGHLYLKLRASGNLEGQKATLLAQMQGTIHWNKTFPSLDSTKVRVPVTDLPMGIARLTMLDRNGMPRAERLVFVNRHKRLFIDVSTDKEKYHPKERVAMTIEVKNHDGKPVPATLALAVADKKRLRNIPDTPDLLAYHHLTSELKGNIGNCNIYFLDDRRADTAMDHLMMTHGWRKYRWEKVLDSPPDDKSHPEPFFTGRVVRNNGKPAKEATVELFRPRFEIEEDLLLQTLQNENSAVQLTNPDYFTYVDKTTDQEGYFHLSASEYARIMDTGKVYIMARRRNGKKDIDFVFNDSYAQKTGASLFEEKKEEILTDVPVFEPRPLFPILPGQDASMKKDYYSRFDENAVMLDEIVVGARRPVKMPEQVKKERYQVLEKDSEDILKQTGGATRDFLSLLRTVTSGFTVDQDKILFRGYNSIIPERQSGALIVLDGINMGENYHNVDFLNAEDIKKIRVIKNAGAALKYTSQNRGGLIVIETKSGAWKKKASGKKPSDNHITAIRGYSVHKEFYSPAYPTKEAKLNSVDLRNTLYWDPEIQVDESGKKTIVFYNSDKKMETVCRVQGMNGKLLGSSRGSYVVY